MPGISGMGNEAIKKWVKDYIQSLGLTGGGINAYPVGSYYFTSDARNPSEILGGGAWEKLEEGRFLMASGDGYPVGSKGGEATHTLTESEMPSHSHSGDAELSGSTYSGGSHSHLNGTKRIHDAADGQYGCTTYNVSVTGPVARYANTNGSAKTAGSYDIDYTSSAGAHTHSLDGVTASITTDSAGSGNAHNNLPPYIAVNIWRRTA